MTSREVVVRTVEFRRPPRLALKGFGPASDCVAIPCGQPVRPAQAGDDPLVDEWLCRWEKPVGVPSNMGQVRGHPVNDLAELKDFPWPDGNDPRRYRNIPAKLDELDANRGSADKYVLSVIFMVLWERMHSVHGFENCMIALMDDTPAIHEMADRILDYQIARVRNMHRVAGRRVQGIEFTEDWGTQLDLHISPELWRRFFFPRYQKLFGAIHECGWHVWMHSCGKINKIIGGLIEAGLDVINMQQPRTNGIEEIGRQFAGRICFESLCDIQKTLPRGDRAEIEAEAALLLRTWGTPDGGFVLGESGGHASIGASPDSEQFMLDTFRRLDPYSA